MVDLPPSRPRQVIGATPDGEPVSLVGPFARWLDTLRFKIDELARAAPVPTGSIQMAILDTEPADGEWLFLNGQSISKTDYADLYTIFGDEHGSTALSFNLPDYSNRLPIGAGDIALGAAGGAATVTLTTGNMPSHTHGITDPGHTHTTGAVGGASAASGSDVAIPEAGNTGASTTGVSVDSAGSGEAFSILPPVFAVNWMIKT